MKTILYLLATLFLSGVPAIAQTSVLRPPGGLSIDSGTKTATATAGAATLNKMAGVVTTEPLSTAAGATYTLTITNTTVTVSDTAFASVAYGTSTTGTPAVSRVTPGAGTLTIVVRNADASAAFNGTLKVSFFVLRN